MAERIADEIRKSSLLVAPPIVSLKSLNPAGSWSGDLMLFARTGEQTDRRRRSIRRPHPQLPPRSVGGLRPPKLIRNPPFKQQIEYFA